MPEVRAGDGIPMAVRAEGPEGAPAVLLLHSIGSDHGMWRDQAQALARSSRVIMPDARGHGGSGAPEGDYTLARLGQDAIDVLDALGVARAHVCGLSLGGLTAQWLAVHAPERIAGLVLASTAPRIGAAAAWQDRADLVRREGMAAVADLAMGRFFSPAFRAARRDVVEASRQVLLATSAVGYAGCCAALRDADLSGEITRIHAPTLVIAAREDVSTPPEQVRALAATIPCADYLELPAGHLSNLERPDDFTRALRRRLEGLLWTTANGASSG